MVGSVYDPVGHTSVHVSVSLSAYNPNGHTLTHKLVVSSANIAGILEQSILHVLVVFYP